MCTDAHLALPRRGPQTLTDLCFILILASALAGGCAGTQGSPDGGDVIAGCPPLTISTTHLPEAQVGLEYEATLTAQGGLNQLGWQIHAGDLPPGLLLDGATGMITGVPEAAGDFHTMIKVTDTCMPPQNDIDTFFFNVLDIPCDPLSMRGSLPEGYEGGEYWASVVVEGGQEPYRWSWVGGEFPPGIHLQNDTGYVVGTPLPGSEGTYPVTVKVKDSCLSPQEQTVELTLVIRSANCPELVLEAQALPSATQGMPYTFSLPRSGGEGPFIYEITDSQLPPGLDLDASGGQITGTPTETGNFAFTAQVTDSCISQQTATARISINVSPSTCPALNISNPSLPAGYEDRSYSGILKATGGMLPITWSIVEGSLPDGLELNAATGVIAGVPGETGLFELTVRATDSCDPPQVAERAVLVAISIVGCDLVFVATSSLPSGTVGQAYGPATLEEEGGTAPFTWNIVTGDLPLGLTLDESGTITGTPLQEGRFEFKVKVSDGCDQYGEKAFLVSISPVGCAATQVRTTALPDAEVGKAYTYTLEARGEAPFEWSVIDGVLPQGLALSNGGVIGGSPAVPGLYTITFQVTDSCFIEGINTAVLDLRVGNEGCNPVYISTSSLAPAVYGEEYHQILEAGGGRAPFTWGISGILPEGILLNEATGQLSGTPYDLGPFPITFEVTDSCDPPQGADRIMTLVVGPPNCPDLSILTASLPGALVGVDYEVALTAAGGEGAIVWSVISGQLPAGLTLDADPPAILGTPEAQGTFNFVLGVSDACPLVQEVEQSFTIEVNVPDCTTLHIASETLEEGQVGFYYEADVVVTGEEPFTFTLEEGSQLPEGLNLESSTGRISGTPTTRGNYRFTVRVTDSCIAPQSESRILTLAITEVVCLPMTLTTTRIDTAIIDEPYADSLVVSGGDGVKTFQLNGGTLPMGLEILADGTVTGTPTNAAPGEYQFSVRVRDTCPLGFQTITETVSVTLECPEIIVSPGYLNPGQVGQPYDVTLSAEGTVGASTVWDLVQGTPPPGITITPPRIYGTPTVQGSSAFIISVLDQCRNRVPVEFTYSLQVLSPDCPLLSIESTTLAGGKVGEYYDDMIETNGGDSPLRFEVVDGNFPQGLHLDANTGRIQGSPTVPVTHRFTVEVTDSCYSGSQVVRQNLTIEVEPRDCHAVTIGTEFLSYTGVGDNYVETLVASGGEPPYRWNTLPGTTLPEGLTLSLEGTITGRAISNGHYPFTVVVTDSCWSPQTDSKRLIIVVGSFREASWYIIEESSTMVNSNCASLNNPTHYNIYFGAWSVGMITQIHVTDRWTDQDYGTQYNIFANTTVNFDQSYLQITPLDGLEYCSDIWPGDGIRANLRYFAP